MKYLNLGCQEVEANAFIRLSYAVCSFLLLLSFIKVRLSGEKEARKQYEREIEIVVPSYWHLYFFLSFPFAFSFYFFCSLLSSFLCAASSLQYLDGNHRPCDLLLHDSAAVPQSRLQRVLGSLACGDRWDDLSCRPQSHEQQVHQDQLFVREASGMDGKSGVQGHEGEMRGRGWERCERSTISANLFIFIILNSESRWSRYE